MHYEQHASRQYCIVYDTVLLSYTHVCYLQISAVFCGTTSVLALIRGSTIWLANCGDSRAVLARRSSTAADRAVGIALTVDQKADTPEERDRIESMGGYVTAPLQPGMSSRVW
jgi:serine/threonine protein phosphatase PrpC